MVKYLVAFLGVLLIFSCSDDVSFNSPAFQGIRDTVFFKAAISRAELVNDSSDTANSSNFVYAVRLSGILNDEVVSFTLPYYGEGVFDLNPEDDAYASYSNTLGKEFSTRFDGEGSVVVERIEDSTYTGSFRFRARSASDSTEVYFTKGYFYEVPFYKRPPIEEEIPVVSTFFTCRINGVTFNPLSINASSGSTSLLGVGSTNSVIIRLLLPLDIEPGTYPLTDFSVESPYKASYKSGEFTPIVQSGTVTILSHNKKEKSIGGTFSLVAKGESIINITDGKFGFNY